MKYGRSLKVIMRVRDLRWLTALLVLFLFGCGGAAVKTDDENIEKPLVQFETKQFLPTRQYDKEGVLVPFVPQPNPYMALKGKINKQAIEHFIAARKQLKSKNFDAAKVSLQKITELDKNLAGPWVLLGNIEYEEGKLATAMSHYQKAIEVNPANINAYLPLAKIYREHGEFVKAQNVYAQALGVWAHFPEAHLNLGVLYDLYLNDPLQAQQHMEAYQFLTDEKDDKVAKWLEEIRSRTGIEPYLYIGPTIGSQNEQVQSEQTGL